MIEANGVQKLVKRKVIPQTMFRIKLLTQEVCVATITSIMLLFSLTEQTQFSESKTYRILEEIIILFIIFAIVSEFLWVIFQTIYQISNSTKKSKLEKANTFYVLEKAENLTQKAKINNLGADGKLFESRNSPQTVVQSQEFEQWNFEKEKYEMKIAGNSSDKREESKVKIYRQRARDPKKIHPPTFGLRGQTEGNTKNVRYKIDQASTERDLLSGISDRDLLRTNRVVVQGKFSNGSRNSEKLLAEQPKQARQLLGKLKTPEELYERSKQVSQLRKAKLSVKDLEQYSQLNFKISNITKLTKDSLSRLAQKKAFRKGEKDFGEGLEKY